MVQQFDPYKYGQFDARVGTVDPTLINALIQAAGGMNFGQYAPNAQSEISQLMGSMMDGQVKPGTSVQQLQPAEQGLVNLLQRFGNPDVSTQTADPTSGDSFQVFNSQPVLNTGGGIPAGPPTGGTPGGGTGTNQPPFAIDPNQPLSTPGTPVNQGTAPSDINPFISDTSKQQQDILNNSITQSQNVAGQDLAQMRGIIDPYIQEQFKAFTDPNGPEYQSTIGQLNNVGMADSGAFPQALASRLAPLISQGALDMGMGTLIPSFQNQQGMVGKGFGVQSDLGEGPLNRFIQQQNFNQQAGLDLQLGQMAQPTDLQQFSQFLGGAGKAAGGAAQLAALSWVCTHLKKLGLASAEEVNAVHKKLLPSVFRHPLHWLHYILRAPELIKVADRGGQNWQEVKSVLIDAVLLEPDCESAFQLYRSECKRLCDLHAPELWDFSEVIHAA